MGMSGGGRRCTYLRPYCERAGLTLGDLAAKVGLPVETLRKIDSGRRRPLITTALLLAGALDVEVEDMFGGDCQCR